MSKFMSWQKSEIVNYPKECPLVTLNKNLKSRTHRFMGVRHTQNLVIFSLFVYWELRRSEVVDVQ